MSELRKFRIPASVRATKIEGLGVIRYQIHRLPGIGQRTDKQIDFHIVTENGMNLEDSVILSPPDDSFSFEHEGIVWTGEVR